MSKLTETILILLSIQPMSVVGLLDTIRKIQSVYQHQPQDLSYADIVRELDCLRGERTVEAVGDGTYRIRWNDQPLIKRLMLGYYYDDENRPDSKIGLIKAVKTDLSVCYPVTLGVLMEAYNDLHDQGIIDY